MKANQEIRNYAKEKNVKLWEVAEAINVIDTAFSRMLRHELDDEKKNAVLAAIDNVASGKTA